MTGPISDDYKCSDCGGPVRCAGGCFRRDLDGNVLGFEEGYVCTEKDCDNSGKVVSDEDEVHRMTGVVRQ